MTKGTTNAKPRTKLAMGRTGAPSRKADGAGKPQAKPTVSVRATRLRKGTTAPKGQPERRDRNADAARQPKAAGALPTVRKTRGTGKAVSKLKANHLGPRNQTIMTLATVPAPSPFSRLSALAKDTWQILRGNFSQV